MRRALLAGLVLLGVGVAALFVGNSRPQAIASVDGWPISRDDFREYAVVLTVNGTRDVADWIVLQSLINQHLALVEAERLGLAVSESEIDAAIEALALEEVPDLALPEAGDASAFRDRLRVRLLFEQVKTHVTTSVTVHPEDIDAFLVRFAALYSDLERNAAVEQAEPIVLRELVDGAWASWLEQRRACATIEVFLPGLSLPTPERVAAC